MDLIAQIDEAPMEATEEGAAQDTEQTTESVGEDPVSYNDLVDQDYGTALKIGALPIALFAVLAIAALFVYFARKRSAWTDEELGVTASDRAEASDIDFPTTGDRSAMNETEPAKKL